MHDSLQLTVPKDDIVPLPYLVMILSFSLLLTFLIVDTFAGNQAELCIQAYPNLQITCATAYERRIVVNEQQCRDLCLKMSAQTCQYNRKRMECELYDVVIALGRKHSRQKERSITSMEIAKKSNKTRLCVPSITPAIGFLLLLNDDCSSGQLDHLAGNVTSKSPTFTIPRNNSVNIVNERGKSVNDKLQIPKINTNATIEAFKFEAPFYSSTTTTATLSDTVGHSSADCTPGFSTYIEAIDGIQVIAEGLIILQAPTPQLCLYTCTKNKLMNGGNVSPIKCHSAQYDRISKQCTLFNTSITPVGNTEYTLNKNMVYFEKICISDMVHRKCGAVLRRVPQFVLIGHATAVVDAPTHNYCIETCLRSLEMFGFTCHSAIHFHEYPKSNCILNKDSARTRPEYFTSEREQKVDYIELNQCFISDRKHS